MKIHMYLKDFRPLTRPEGGMEKAVAGLAAGIVADKSGADGNEVVILSESDADHTIPSPDGYLLRCFRNNHKRFHSTLADGLVHYVESEMNSHSLVVLNGIFHPSVARFAKLLRRRQVPHIIAPHDPYHASIFVKNAHLKWPYWYLVERPMLRRASAVQVLDRRHGELLRQYGVKTPVIEVINGCREADILPIEDLQFRDSGPPRILFLGRMDSSNKGLDLLIDAFNEVADNSDADLTLQGPDAGDLASLKARAAALKFGNRIKFLPADFNTPPATIAANYDLFVIPSRFEGFSLAAMEAMIAARPVIITDIAGLAPHIRASGGGAVVDSTVPSIRDGIRAMLGRRAEWRAMGLAGREYALSKFKWNRIAAEAMVEYRKLAH